ncbi:hypothetical protein [Sediminispirochaeta bajacaliforniensis]|uniref:hypothetical protein n=1 Tax=Sediminispirochaeta bajacaliforniensis TaxID=148 RepID=UPI000380B0A9|nr:hypothetical protein [Sediminispirochaeta bajacaliforniensis]
MANYYYLTVYPMEALIVSELDPEQFASYMANGTRKGSAEDLMFIEVRENFSDVFDWEYARQRCVPHSDGRAKNSVYLGVYRILEHASLDVLGDLYLVTRDGRSLRIAKEAYTEPKLWKGFALYKELCPVSPLVVSALNPKHFGQYMTSPKNKVMIPTLVYASLKVIDLEDRENTGNVGGLYDHNIEHLKSCINDLTSGKGKMTKVVDRSYSAVFSYQVIREGIYVASNEEVVFYPMPDRETLKQQHYDWARSALIF